MYPGSLKLEALQMSQECWNVGSFKPPIFPVESFFCFQDASKVYKISKNGELSSQDSSVSGLYAVEISLCVTFSSRRSGAPKVFSFQLNNGSIGLVTSGMATRMNTSAKPWGHFKGPKPIRRIMMDRLLHDSPTDKLRQFGFEVWMHLSCKTWQRVHISQKRHLLATCLLSCGSQNGSHALHCGAIDAACHGVSYAFMIFHMSSYIAFPAYLGEKWQMTKVTKVIMNSIHQGTCSTEMPVEGRPEERCQCLQWHGTSVW